MQIYKHYNNKMLLLLILIFTMVFPATTMAQDPTPVPDDGTPPIAPERVDVQPLARDEEIETRLNDIYLATGWFVDSQVRVQDGVVFLSGQSQSEEYKIWAGNLARNTQDVVAVVNQLEIIEPPLLDFQPMLEVLRNQGRSILRSIPLIGFSLIILFFTWLIARLMTRTVRQRLHTQEMNILLRNVISNTIGVLIFLVGLYLVFQVAGWTNIALTIIGGTGLLGLILGIAFQDITENFLASIFLSVQNPFNVGDLVEISGILGFVQNMTTRTTIVMTLAGNHVQIPNATVYKSVIHNYTSNPNRRIDFIIGIGYDDSISLAQETVRAVLEAHTAVLNEPEHLVLVDSLGSATVNLQIYFWIDGTEHSWLKVKSSVIRLIKRAIQDAGISMPDEAREMIFPNGVPVTMLKDSTETNNDVRLQPTEYQPEDDTISTSAEGDLSSEAKEIEKQAKESRAPELGENLLKQ